MLNLLLALIASYLIGSIPTSYLIGRSKGIDVRREGSGNVGATNVLRVMGKIPAILTLIADILKGVIPVTVIANFFYKDPVPVTVTVFSALLGLSAVAGHNWSVFLRFKGGKGVATTCGVFLILLPGATAAAALVFAIAVLLTRYVSLGSILLAITVPIVAALTGQKIELVILSVTLCCIISYRHKANIKRLLIGTENKVGRSKS